MESNHAYWQAWRSMLPDLEDDADLSFSRLGRSFGLNAYRAEKVFEGMLAMGYLPELAKLHEVDWFLDHERLVAIGYALRGVEEEAYPAVDAALKTLFTPRRQNQHLPDAARIRSVIEEVLSQFYLPQSPAEKAEDYSVTRFGEQASLNLTSDAATMEAIDRLVRKRAASDGISFAAALVALVLDPVTTTITINAFQADGSSLAYLPGYGYLKDIDLPCRRRDIGPGASAGYKPGHRVRAFVEGRDGNCRWPGCKVPAQRCQLDHRVEYEQGGPTSTDNLFCLCQHHHNVKTDRRAFYVGDPITGDVFWLFADGTWESTVPEGPIAHWSQSVGERIAAAPRRKI